jgi:hypothetical protein
MSASNFTSSIPAPGSPTSSESRASDGADTNHTTPPESEVGEARQSATGLSEHSDHTRAVLGELFSENVIAKMLRVAVESLENNVRKLPSVFHTLVSDIM